MGQKILALESPKANQRRTGGSADLAQFGQPLIWASDDVERVEATLSGVKPADHAVPINFLLQAQQIAALMKASSARIQAALRPHPFRHI